jgi:hypothetical protein
MTDHEYLTVLDLEGDWWATPSPSLPFQPVTIGAFTFDYNFEQAARDLARAFALFDDEGGNSHYVGGAEAGIVVRHTSPKEDE